MLFLLIKCRCEPGAPGRMHIGQDWSTHARTGAVSTWVGRALKHPSSSTLVTGPLHILTSYAGPQEACAHRAMQTCTGHILPSAATWMDPEGVTLSEKSQTEKDKHRSMWNQNRKQQKKSSQIRRTNWRLPEAGVAGGRVGEGGQKAQTPSDKTSQCWEVTHSVGNRSC